MGVGRKGERKAREGKKRKEERKGKHNKSSLRYSSGNRWPLVLEQFEVSYDCSLRSDLQALPAHATD